MKRGLFVLVALVPAVQAEGAGGFRPSFFSEDLMQRACVKAQTAVERMICSDPQVQELDNRLDRSYGVAGSMWDRRELADDQRDWLKNVRGKCEDSACLVRAYTARIEELSGPRNVTGTYQAEGSTLKVKDFPSEHRVQFEIHASNDMNVGELAGMAQMYGGEASYPRDEERRARADEDCTLRMTFPKGKAVVKQQGGCGMGLNVTASGTYALMSREAPSLEIAPVAAEPANKKPDLNSMVARHALQIAGLGFPPKFLKSVIYLQQDLYNRPQAFITFEQWLALLFENKAISKLTSITAGKSQGVSVKSPGVESHGFLFKFDEGDLFPTHVVKGDKAIPIETNQDAYTVAIAIAKVATDAIQ